MQLPCGKQNAQVYGILKMIDLQNSVSIEQLYLDEVGIRNLKHPALVQHKDRSQQPTIANFSMAVGLNATKRGTHMSRFLEILNEKQWVLSIPCIQELLVITAERFKTDRVVINSNFTFFLKKLAPISKTPGLLDYEVSLNGMWHTNKNQTHSQKITLTVTVPVTTLCPCSKEISDYGAHNQRSYIKLQLTTDSEVCIEDLIRLIEQEGSCEIYSILKRADEKFVTEHAYNNPRFVEDIVRNIASKLNRQKNIKYSHYKIESESIESIHNHSAYAMIEHTA